MKLIAQLKLQPTPDPAEVLRRTLRAANAACDLMSDVAWNTRTFGKFALQKLCYQDVREQFDLSAQMTLRALAKVGDAYKLDKQTKRTFRPLRLSPTTTASSRFRCPPRPFRSGHLTDGSPSHSCAVSASDGCLPRAKGRATCSTTGVCGICW